MKASGRHRKQYSPKLGSKTPSQYLVAMNRNWDSRYLLRCSKLFDGVTLETNIPCKWHKIVNHVESTIFSPIVLNIGTRIDVRKLSESPRLR